MRMCHSCCNRAACLERRAEGNCICTIANSLHNNSFGAFPLCETNVNDNWAQRNCKMVANYRQAFEMIRFLNSTCLQACPSISFMTSLFESTNLCWCNVLDLDERNLILIFELAHFIQVWSNASEANTIWPAFTDFEGNTLPVAGEWNFSIYLLF